MTETACNAAVAIDGASTDWAAHEAARINADTALQIRKHMGLLDEDEVAAILKLNSTGTLATWRSQKIGPRSVKLGKRVFYTVNQLGTWINERAAAQDAAFNAPPAA